MIRQTAKQLSRLIDLGKCFSLMEQLEGFCAFERSACAMGANFNFNCGRQIGT